MSHFVDCVADGLTPLETGEDGRAVLRGRGGPQTILAAYESAATGRRVEWPWVAPRGRTGAEVWGR